MSRHTAWNAEEARALLAGMAETPGPALVMLQAVQARFGFVPGEASFGSRMAVRPAGRDGEKGDASV